MADRPLTPEEIEQYRAFGNALLRPQEVRHGFGVIGNILNAIAGQRYLDETGNRQFMQRTTEGARYLPPIGGGQNAPQPTQMPQRPPVAAFQPQQPQQLQQPQPTLPPAQISPGNPNQLPSIEGSPPNISSPQPPPTTMNDPSGSLSAPNQLSPRADQMLQPNREAEARDIQRYAAGVGREPSRYEIDAIKKYGVDFMLDVVKNGNTPIATIFAKYPMGMHTLEGTFPNSLLGNKDPNKITAREWFDEVMLHSAGISEQELPTPRMNLGGPMSQEQDQFQSPRLNSATPDISPNGAAMPFRRPPDAPQDQPARPPNATPPRQRVAQVSGGVGGGTGQVNDGDVVAPTVPVNTEQIQALEANVASLERQLGNAGTLTPDRLNTLADAYMKARTELGRATAPIEVKTQFGTAKYNARTGQLESFSPEPQNITTPSGGVPTVPGRGPSLNVPSINSPGGAGGQNNNQQPSGNSTDMRVPQHPLGSFFTGMEQHAQDTAATRQLSDKAVEALNSARDSGLQAYEIQNTLDLLRTETERAGRFSEGGAYRGPGAQWIMRAKQLLSNFGIDIPGLESLGPQEQIEKIITQLGSAATRQLSNRPANFEFQTILNAFPGMATSYEGAIGLIDYLQQVQDRAIEIGNMAESLPVEQRGRWNRILRDYYEQNPIVITIPAGETLQRLYGITTPIRVTTKRISPGEERNLPSDTYFIRGGELHRGDGGTPQNAPAR